MILKRHIVFTGTVNNMTAYFSKSGQCIIRAKSSITGARIVKDPVFEGFRQSSVRMMDASPLASALYQVIPKERRKFKLFRLLTGEALKMLKQGVNKATILSTLQQAYIDPVLNRGTIKERPSKGKESSPGAMHSFIQYPFAKRSSNRTRVKRRHRMVQHGSVMKRMDAKEDSVYDYEGSKNTVARPSDNTSTQVTSIPKRIYLGRNKLYRKFKIWLLPEGEDDPGMYSALYHHTVKSYILKSSQT